MMIYLNQIVIFFSIINISLCVPAGESAVVQTQQTVMAAAGGEAHLSCQLSQPKDVSEITWKKIVSGTGENVAFNSQFYGERVVSKFRGRVQISSSGVQNSSIVVRNVSEEDEGCFLCLFNAFPEGALKGRTCLLVYELDQPLLHVRASAAGSVISCSATGRPPPNVTLTVGQQHLHSYNCTVSVNANSTFTVTAAAVLPGPGSTNTQVGCSAAVFSGPQLTASVLLPALSVKSASVHSRDRLALNIAAVMVGLILSSALIFYIWRRH
ncbi:OX-2 membrane glycoprotein-like [Oryzias melastigma]|uniref:Ig-like domain-containing protein n=1 Tax=Oryzias melastigma TaxID=30732 RepID=A0A3B3BVW4_ORYME|nr:OX-2 membrane glycoprotein-like [Oryzias melastigma]XP_036066601.1 OX-2 membrane glycoprotein-like [Oryzias melastigma]